MAINSSVMRPTDTTLIPVRAAICALEHSFSSRTAFRISFWLFLCIHSRSTFCMSAILSSPRCNTTPLFFLLCLILEKKATAPPEISGGA